MFEKRLSELTNVDIRDMVNSKASEGMDLEFKQSFDGNPGTDNARDDIVKEVIAFANAYGGTLVVGILEDPDRRAGAIYPVQNCKEVADRLARSVPDVIEPRIPGFECEGVITEENGRDGVLVLRVPSSILGPHRHTIKSKSSSGQVYVRRNTESVMASMREIHDLVLDQARGSDRLLDLRVKAYERFDGERARISLPESTMFPVTEASFVAVAVPVPRLQVPDLIGRMPVEPRRLEFPATLPGGHHHTIEIPVRGRGRWSPRLRGIRYVAVDPEMAVSLDAGQDGVVATGFWYKPPETRLEKGKPRIRLSWLLATAASVLVRLDKARRRASYPDAQYIVTGRLILVGEWLMALSHSDYHSDQVAVGHPLRVVLPEHLVGSTASYHETMLSIERDIVNASGSSFQFGPKINFDDILQY